MERVFAYLENRFSMNAEVKAALIELFQEYAKLGVMDSKFETDFTSGRDEHFYGYIWEMVLALHLKGQGLDIESSDHGPDFRFLNDGKLVWVEAICPAPKGIPEDWFVIPGIHDPPRVKNVPHEQILLRWTSALKEKKEKLSGRVHADGSRCSGYLEDGVVGKSDPYVIAISACQLGPNSLNLDIGISQLPYAVEACFPIGPIELVLDRNTGRSKEQRRSYRAFIEKPNGAEVPTDSFLNPDFSGVSALLGSSAGINAACGARASVSLVHNPLADNPLPLGILGADQEFVAQDCGDHFELHDVCHD